MKLFRLLIATAFFCGVVHSASAQQVTVNLKQVKLVTILDAITEQTGYSFYHSRPAVNPDEITSLTVSNAKLETALDQLFAGTSIGYEINNGKIYLIEKQSNTTVAAATPPAKFRERCWTTTVYPSRERRLSLKTQRTEQAPEWMATLHSLPHLMM